ncbi:MAG: hypothetical protein IPL53_13915 [Ignavibacteria bacterium]|nr:hypothetical protein [Ignavibacteria bacterium]
MAADELKNERENMKTLFNYDSVLKELTELYLIEDHCGPSQIQDEYLSEVRGSDVLIILFKKELREAVKKEFLEAKRNNKSVFCYVKNNETQNENLEDFTKNEVFPNSTCGKYNDSEDLVDKIQNDLITYFIKIIKSTEPSLIKQVIPQNVFESKGFGSY